MAGFNWYLPSGSGLVRSTDEWYRGDADVCKKRIPEGHRPIAKLRCSFGNVLPLFSLKVVRPI